MGGVFLKICKSFGMTAIDRDNDRYKNDRNMTEVLYGGVRGFWVRRCSIITTQLLTDTLKRYQISTFNCWPNTLKKGTKFRFSVVRRET